MDTHQEQLLIARNAELEKELVAKNRKLQIESALERVRSRSLSMHLSTELKDVVAILFQQLKLLSIGFDGGAAIHLFREHSKDAFILVASPELALPIEVNLPYDEAAFFNNPVISDVLKAKETGNHIFNRHYSFEEKNRYFDYVFKHNNLETIPQSSRDLIDQADSYTASFIAEKNSLLGANSWSRQLFSENDFEVLIRFAKVFEQSYIRFLDLQNAEAQSRESQIQLALERVRARTMSMQKSDELAEVATLLFKQVNDLNIKTWTTGFNVWTDDNNGYEDWITSPQGGFVEPYKIDATSFPVFMEVSDAKKRGEEFFVQYLEGELLKQTYQELSKFGDKKQFEKMLEGGFQFPTHQYDHFVFGAKVSLMFITYEPVPEAHLVFKRFGKVFEQTYTRFLDLQKAEAQAREAQVEAALERVRASAMAMHSSKDLYSVADVLHDQLSLLGKKELESSLIHLYPENSVNFEVWYSYRPLNVLTTELIRGHGSIPRNICSWTMEIIRKYSSEEATYTIESRGNMLADWYNVLEKYAPDTVNYDAAGKIILPEVLYYHFSKFSGGALLMISDEVPDIEACNLQLRAAKVFEMAYRRFKDLETAEAQAREAMIEAALERIRSRTLAMQKSDELPETATVLFKQLISLGIATNRLYIGIIHEESGDIEFWVTDEDVCKISTMFSGNANKNLSMKKMYDGWVAKKKFVVIDMKGKELADYFQYLGDGLHVPFKEGLSQKRVIQYITYFSNGFIGMALPDKQQPETISLLDRFAYVFNLTFTRFNDLKLGEAHAVQAEEDLIRLQTEKKRAEDALVELRAAQKQLIQSEKMASLGELTAGIAHEIQNPLNFVNNFSEVSIELLADMKDEFDRGNAEEALRIAGDIIENLGKINHHGKRADAIVKGMLQHSRASAGQKESTDINALADEYLRLTYHGLRAKDKTFNATLQTDFDRSIGLINVISQDIGRVLLNLYTNAFYTVVQKKTQQPEGYEPVVSVITQKESDNVTIAVKDNGNGISQNVVDKIFQPFFTTKPTGQGTGLGLSLIYDIVKAHGGTIKVETIEGEGSTFTIQIPINS